MCGLGPPPPLFPPSPPSGIPHLGTPFLGGPLLGVANAFPSFCSLWDRIRLFFAELVRLKARFSRAFTGKRQQLRPHFNSPPSLYCYLVGAFPFFVEIIDILSIINNKMWREFRFFSSVCNLRQQFAERTFRKVNIELTFGSCLKRCYGGFKLYILHLNIKGI